MADRPKRMTSLSFLLDKGNFRPHQYRGTRIPLQNINVLVQPRRTFQEIDILAEDIASKSLLHPLTVAQFDTKSCRKYLSLINSLWKTTYNIDELADTTENGRERVFYILLAGERRFRACLHLRDIGCERCLEEFGPNGCYKRHFGDESVDIRLCINIAPLEAIFIQASENIHMKVPPYEEATFYYQLFRLIKQIDPDYPLSRFARQVGRSPDTIRNAVRFCLLPAEIKGFVERDELAYGIACEIARIQKQAETEKEALKFWVFKAITGNYRVQEFREVVTSYLRAHNSGQMSLLDIMGEKQREDMERSYFRWVVERQSIMAIWSWIFYFNRVTTLFLEGKLGRKDSPFSEGSPVRVFRRLLKEEERLLPHLRSFLPKRNAYYQRVEEALMKTKEVLSQLEKKQTK